MNFPQFSVFRATLAFVALSFSVVDAQTRPVVAMRDAATHEQLSEILRKSEQEDPMKSLRETKGVDPSVVNRPKDILSQSDIICYGGSATLVPKRAILQMPKNFSDRLKLQPGVKIQGWAEFYAANRGWITTVEVSRIQAQGRNPIPEETQRQMVKSGNLIVAVLKGGPISVLPPPPVPEETETTSTKP